MLNPVFHCEDGDEALDYLYRRGAYSDARKAPRPALILLDLNLPGVDGREVLAEIKADEDLKVIPVVILTTSSDERDVAGCYKAGANSYVQKSIEFDILLKAIKQIKDYWLDIVILPDIDQKIS